MFILRKKGNFKPLQLEYVGNHTYSLLNQGYIRKHNPRNTNIPFDAQETLLRNIYNVVKDPKKNADGFESYVKTLKTCATPLPGLARDDWANVLIIIGGIAGIVTSVFLAPVTGCISLVGLAPSISLLVYGIRREKKADDAKALRQEHESYNYIADTAKTINSF